MFEARTLRSISIQALLIVTIIQGMTADVRDLASPFLLRRLVPELATGPCEARGLPSPIDEGSGPSRNRDDEDDTDEICVPAGMRTASASCRDVPGQARGRPLSSRSTGWFVPSTGFLPGWSPGAAPRDRNATLLLCRLTC
ncbi:MAG TPA: hypothetical protein VFF52_18250 [Isosphaeraceae bacterium]|nr:hypothetical protein [Isosphaeraceae bacterium]